MPFLKLDSAQRNNRSSTTASQFVISSTTMLFEGRYRLKAVFMPVTYYNVSTQTNAIYFTDGTGSHIAYVTPGFYTSTSYVLAVGTAMTIVAGGATYTVTLDPITQNATISASAGTFILTFGTNTLRSAYAQLGFPQSNSTTATSSQIAPTMLYLAQTRSFNISVNGYSSTFDVTGRGYTYVLPVTSNTPGIEYYEAPESYQQEMMIDSPTRSLNIAVYDDFNNILPIQSDWYMILEKRSNN